MNLAELYRELERHDWFFEMSDDHRVWSAGHEDKRRLIRESLKIEGGQKLMADFSKHHFSGEAFGTPKAPKPPRPAGPKEEECPRQEDEWWEVPK